MSTDVPFWKRALGTVVHLEDDPPVKTVTTSSPAIPVASSTAPTPDQGLYTALMKSALARKTTFSGLIESAERLRNVPGMDDTQRIKAAAAMAGNVTAEMITQAAASHASDIAIERSKFGREITAIKATRVETVLAQASSLEGQVQASLAEIQRLNAQITALTEQATTLRSSATAAEAELAQTTTTFETTVAQVEQYIVTTRDSIVSALK